MVAMAPPEGEEDRSQAYYVIKVTAIKPVIKTRDKCNVGSKQGAHEPEYLLKENDVPLSSKSN